MTQKNPEESTTTKRLGKHCVCVCVCILIFLNDCRTPTSAFRGIVITQRSVDMVADSLIHISMNYFNSLQLGSGLFRTHIVFLHVMLHVFLKATFTNFPCQIDGSFKDAGVCHHFINVLPL